MQLLITLNGDVRCVYDERIDLAALGHATIARASHVEPDVHGRWQADMTPVGGPMLQSYATRSEALAAEQAWLEENWLNQED